MESIKVNLGDLDKLANKTILITGGCSGIGLSLVELLFSTGCNLIVGDLQAPPANHDAFSSDRTFYRKTDVTDWAQLRTLFNDGSKFHPIDIVAANAGINEYHDQFFDPKFGESGELLEPDYRVLDVNLRGASNTVALAIHHFKDRGGSIIITASLAGYMSASGMPVYGASKHGVWGLMRSLKYPLKARNIAISLVAPGFTKTPIMADLPGHHGLALPTIFDALHKAGLLSNEPETVASAIVYLALGGMESNGKGLAVEDEQIVDLEKMLLESRPPWVLKKLQYLFPNASNAAVWGS